jgi:hypothetical protein
MLAPKSDSENDPKNDPKTAPLGIYARFVATGSTGGSTVDEVIERRLLVWALQSEARDILLHDEKGRKERVCDCCRKVVPIALGIDIYHHPQFQAVSFKGLIRCASVWMCLVCATKICERRRGEIEQAISRCNEADGFVYMETYTYSHKREDDLKLSLQAFTEARRVMKMARKCREIRKAFGVVGTVSVLEVTWSYLNGFHVHAHELVFCEGGTCGSLVYEAEMRAAWERAAAGQGLTMDHHGYRLDQTRGAIADYVAKYGHAPERRPWGIEDEMAKGHVKRGRGPVQHLTPFEMLLQIYEGHDALVPIWREYARVFKGRHQLHWSPGLKKRYGIAEKSDMDLIEESTEDAVLLGRLRRRAWKIVLANDLRGELYELARQGNWNSVVDFLLEIGVHQDDLLAGKDIVEE